MNSIFFQCLELDVQCQCVRVLTSHGTTFVLFQGAVFDIQSEYDSALEDRWINKGVTLEVCTKLPPLQDSGAARFSEGFFNPMDRGDGRGGRGGRRGRGGFNRGGRGFNRGGRGGCYRGGSSSGGGFHR